jgi:hypothetical protein
MVFIVNDELSKYKCMSCNNSQVSRPKLCSLDARGVDGKGIIFQRVSGCGLQTLDIRPVSDLGLSIASENMIVLSLFEPFLLLSFGAKHFNAFDKHRNMDAQRILDSCFEQIG